MSPNPTHSLDLHSIPIFTPYYNISNRYVDHRCTTFHQHPTRNNPKWRELTSTGGQKGEPQSLHRCWHQMSLMGSITLLYNSNFSHIVVLTVTFTHPLPILCTAHSNEWILDSSHCPRARLTLLQNQSHVYVDQNSTQSPLTSLFLWWFFSRTFCEPSVSIPNLLWKSCSDLIIPQFNANPRCSPLKT